MGKDASEIRREIEETRARMGDTVEALGYKADVPSRVKDAVNERVETVREAIGDAVATVKETVAGASGYVGEAAGKVTEAAGRVGDVAGEAAGRVGEAAGGIREKLPSPDAVTGAARRGVGMVQENPLGLALGALAVGFLAGLAAPVSELERRTVGPLRDGLVERAKVAGGDAIEHGKQLLQEKAQAVLGAAQQQRRNGTL